MEQIFLQAAYKCTEFVEADSLFGIVLLRADIPGWLCLNVRIVCTSSVASG